jgi:hypothetical protein
MTQIFIHPSIHPSYSTKAHSQALASQNFFLLTVLFCEFNFQFQHLRSLAASYFTTSSHLNAGLPTGQLPVNSTFRTLSGMRSRRSICKCPAHWILLNSTQGTRLQDITFFIKFFIISDPPHSFLSCWYKHSPYNIPFERVRVFNFLRFSRFHNHMWGLC